MTVAAAGEIYEVVVEGRLEEQLALNVLFFRTPTGSSNVELQLLRALFECYMDTLIPVLPTDYNLVRVHGKRVTPDVGPVIEVGAEDGDTLTGAATGDALPSFVSSLINIHTSRGGRSGRGRIFVAGVPEVATIRSFISKDSAYWTALLAFAACLVSKFVTSSDPPVENTWDLGVMSRKLGASDPAHIGKPPFLNAGFAPAVRLVAKDQLATTRSRLVGRGA